MTELAIAPDFTLPLETATQTFAILAKRGMGKTYTAMVMTEELLKAGIQVCVVDPVGVWWGLRTSADGQSEGLPIAVLGGDHADLPLTEDMGEAVAGFLVQGRASIVLDLSLFRKAAMARFMTAFAEALYRLNREALHLVLDEADVFAPQRPMKGQERMLGAMEDIVRRGWARGLGVTMITQRPAVLNKDVLTQIEVLITLRITSPQDRSAIDAWVKQHGSDYDRDLLMDSLASLPVGSAWFWSPGWLKIFRQVAIRQRETFDSSATPKAGESVSRPDVVAAIDLSSLQEALDESLKKAEATDVKALQAKVLSLQKQLAAKPEVKVERIEVPILEDEKIAELKHLAEAMMSQARELIACSEAILTTIAQASPATSLAATNGLHPLPRSGPIMATRQPGGPPVIPVRPVPESEPEESEDIKLVGGEKTILETLANRYPLRFTRAQVGELSGYSHRGETFNKYFGRLKKFGLLLEEHNEISATEFGIAMAGVIAPAPPTSHAEMMAMWTNALEGGPTKLLTTLSTHYPHYLDRETLGALTDYESSGGTFNKYLGILRRNNLIEEDAARNVRLSSTLFPELAG